MRRVRYSVQQGIGALDTFDVSKQTLFAAADAKYRILSLQYTANWNDIKAVEDNSLTFGVAHGAYSAAEIEEALEATTSINQGNLIARERANRMIRILGSINGNVDAVNESAIFDHGKEHKVRLNWEIPIGVTLDTFVFNRSTVIWTTGSDLGIAGVANVVYS